MKWVFILLLLANVAFLGWQLNRDIEQTARQPETREPPLRGEPIKLLSELDKRPQRRLKPGDGEANGNERKLADKDRKGGKARRPRNDLFAEIPDCEAPKQKTEIKDKTACRRVGPFTTARAASEFATLVEQRGGRTIKKGGQCKEKRSRFWVYLPPLKSKKEVQQKLASLRQKPIKDFLAIRKGVMKHAISLGVYSAEDSAKRRADELEKHGLKPVVAPQYQLKEMYWLNVHLPDAPFFESLPKGMEAIPIACNKPAKASPEDS